MRTLDLLDALRDDFVPVGELAGDEAFPDAEPVGLPPALGSGGMLAWAAPSVATGVPSVDGRVALTRITRWPWASGAVISTVSRNSAGSKATSIGSPTMRWSSV